MIREASNVEVFLHHDISGAEVIWVELTPYRWNMMGMRVSWPSVRSIACMLWSGETKEHISAENLP